MEFESLLEIVGEAPVFETGLLLAGTESPNYIRRQLSGWVNADKIWQLRRGLYTLAPPYQKTSPHPFLIANRMMAGSYVSLQSALGFYGLIPEYVPVTTSITTGRPGEWQTPVGHFTFRHIQPDFFYGCRSVSVTNEQQAFVAAPEKALLDLIYLQPRGDKQAYLESLRLQNVERLELDTLHEMAAALDKPKLYRAVEALEAVISDAGEGYTTL